MAGVKLGDRLLAVGLGDVPLVAALARKAGLTGRAVAVDADETRVSRAAAAMTQEGALVEATTAPWNSWPFDANSFDVVVVSDLLGTLREADRKQCLLEVARVLRPGGRIVVIEPASESGLAALFTRRAARDASYIATGGARRVLDDAGFAGARVLAEQGGRVFVEGAKRA
jgi:ubiquinone/menaquinone biosynthesis C-methylase UbiE